MFQIDDVNMPSLDQYGSRPAIETLRHSVEHRGLYDSDDHNFRFIDNTNYMIIAAPPGGGRNPMSARFVRHFNFFNYIRNLEQYTFNIYGQILKGFFKTNFFKQEII